ncbi:hypothetical protein HK104_009943 [Borealophlyctis nickersoniae]|nr:hypothetical protein HK104_009943 [Borealophlyctis nickersoniae]
MLRSFAAAISRGQSFTQRAGTAGSRALLRTSAYPRRPDNYPDAPYVPNQPNPSPNNVPPGSPNSQRAHTEPEVPFPSNGYTPTYESLPASPHWRNNHGISSNRFRVITLAIGAFTSICLYVGATHTEAAVTDDGKEDSGFSAVGIEQKDQVDASRRKAGVWAWGSNNYGLVAPEEAEKVIKNAQEMKFFQGQVLRGLAFAERHAAAIDLDGNLLQWGVGHYLAGDRKANAASVQPEVTLAGRDLVQLACTHKKVYALSRKGEVFVLSAKKDVESETAQTRAEAKKRGELKAGSWLWGGGEEVVVKLRGSERIKSIAGGAHHLVALSSGGKLYAVAADSQGNKWGQLGQFDAPTPSGPEDAADFAVDLLPVSSVRNIKFSEVACGDNHTLARTSDGRVFAFGNNNFGQLGRTVEYEEGQSFSAAPLEVDSLWSNMRSTAKPLDWKCSKIAAGGNTSLFVVEKPKEIEVLACGMGQFGQLGHGGFHHIMKHPQRVKVISGLSQYSESSKAVLPIGITSLVAGATHCAAVLDNHTGSHVASYGRDTVMWGQNMHNELARGDGKKGNASSPVWVAGIGYDGPVTVQKMGTENGGEFANAGMGRLQLAPAGPVTVNGKKVTAEQDIALGHGVTAVYFKVAGKR